MKRDIGEQLGISERTVKNYIFHIFDKIGVSSRVELVLHATAHKQDTSPAASSSSQQASIPSSAE